MRVDETQGASETARAFVKEWAGCDDDGLLALAPGTYGDLAARLTELLARERLVARAQGRLHEHMRAPRALPQDRDAAVGEVVEAAKDLNTYEDWGDAWLCAACAPPEPADYIAARQRLADALARLAPPQRAPAEPGDVTD